MAQLTDFILCFQTLLSTFFSLIFILFYFILVVMLPHAAYHCYYCCFKKLKFLIGVFINFYFGDFFIKEKWHTTYSFNIFVECLHLTCLTLFTQWGFNSELNIPKLFPS